MEKYIAYLDILGFEKLPKEISEKTSIPPETIRENYFSTPLKKKIEFFKKKINRSISEIEGSDSYILLFDNIFDLQYCLGHLLVIDIPVEGYEFIPLEIAIDLVDFDEGDVGLINSDKIIEFLKNNILTPYRKYYKKMNGCSIKESFIVITSKYYEKVDNFDKERCAFIDYDKKKFYNYEINDMIIKVKVYDFLNKIGIPIISTYNKINDLFVDPNEYLEIKKILKEKKLVILTGTPEFGKTYTAVRLLWEYYLLNYSPIWEKGSETSERTKVRAGLENIAQYLQKKSITYLEDPFGKIKYERRESLERIFGDVIKQIDNSEESYVIITSREEIFKTFLKERYDEDEIEEFESKLNIKKPSYDYNKRINLLMDWAKYFDCDWIKEEHLKNDIIEKINADVLPSPLSIKSFAVSTKKELDINKIYEEMENKSKETVYAFADELLELDNHLLVLLFFPFIGDIKSNLVANKYDKILDELKIKSEMKYVEVLNWFYHDKISIMDGYMNFSHPSYYEAFEYVLKNKPRSNMCILLHKFLIAISKIRELNSSLLVFLGIYFDDIKLEIREKCLELVVKNNDDYDQIGQILLEKYDEIGGNIKHILLKKLSENDYGSEVCIDVLMKYEYEEKNIEYIKDITTYGNKESNIKLIEYIIKLYGEEKIKSNFIDMINSILKNNFSAINLYIKNNLYNKGEGINYLLDVLIKNNISSHEIGLYMFHNYDDSRLIDIMKYLLRDDGIYEDDARISCTLFSKYFEKISTDERDKILLDLAKNPDAALNIISIIRTHKNNIDNKVIIKVVKKIEELEGDIKEIIDIKLKYLNV